MKAVLLTLVAFTLTGCTIRTASYKQGGSSSANSGSPAAQIVRLPATHEQIHLTYRVEGSNAILDSDKFTLVFPNLPAGQRKAFSFNAGSLPIQVAGKGRAENSVSCRRNLSKATFVSRYENGTNTIDFCGRRVSLSDNARLVTVGGQTIEISDGKREVLVLATND